jgi:hypothetical protein
MLLYYIMTNYTPVVTVTCLRDIPLLDLQAQGISQYLDTNTPVYIIINEDDPSKWVTYFNQHLKHYYSKHKIKLLHKSVFDIDWQQWVPSLVNPWAVGWETQQVLKLAISAYFKTPGYLILDSSNFLIRPWSPDQYDIPKGKIPCRFGTSGLPHKLWTDYANGLGLPNILAKHPNTVTINSFPATPMYLRTDLVSGLINTKGGINKFSKWFKHTSQIKSEFILYAVWLEYHGGIDRLHHYVDDWGNPYLRDSRTNFAQNFEDYINFIGKHLPLCWSSINHRSWGDMTTEQYIQITEKLAEFNLVPHFLDYRKNYVDIVF